MVCACRSAFAGQPQDLLGSDRFRANWPVNLASAPTYFKASVFGRCRPLRSHTWSTRDFRHSSTIGVLGRPRPRPADPRPYQLDKPCGCNAPLQTEVDEVKDVLHALDQAVLHGIVQKRFLDLDHMGGSGLPVLYSALFKTVRKVLPFPCFMCRWLHDFIEFPLLLGRLASVPVRGGRLSIPYECSSLARRPSGLSF